MSEEFKVGSLSAKAGEKVQGYLEVAGTPVKMPITLINGKKPGKTVVITGGTHGGEYPGVETSIRVAAALTPDEVCGRVAVVHPVNTPAFFAKLQYVGPYDGKNLNREYPGKATGTVTQRIAYTISSELFTQADFYMDLHGGDIHESLTPFVLYSELGSPEQTKVAKEGASMLGVPYVVGSVSDNGTFGSAAKMGVPGFLAEIGQCGLWSEAEVETYVKGVYNVLKYLDVLEAPAEKLCEVTYLHRMAGLDAEQTGCWYPCVKIGDKVKKGQKLGEIRDCFAKVLGEYFAPQDGVMLYVISSLAINAGDPIIALG